MTQSRTKRDLRGVVALLAPSLLPLSCKAPPKEEPPVPMPSASASAVVVVTEPTPEDMVLVQPATFTMGSDDGKDYERPARKVTITRAYFVDKTEVTSEAYGRCVEAGTCTPSSIHGPAANPEWIAKHSSQCTGGDPSRAQHPINCIDLRQADTFCRSVGKRLPTEAEWELAARGTDGRSFPWGEASSGCEQAIVGGCLAGTGPVGSRPRYASPSGAQDMAGSVWEWVADGWSFSPAARGEVKDPFVPRGPMLGVLRGGSWDFSAPSARTFSRIEYTVLTGNVSIGVRCARGVGEKIARETSRAPQSSVAASSPLPTTPGAPSVTPQAAAAAENALAKNPATEPAPVTGFPVPVPQKPPPVGFFAVPTTQPPPTGLAVPTPTQAPPIGVAQGAPDKVPPTPPATAPAQGPPAPRAGLLKRESSAAVVIGIEHYRGDLTVATGAARDAKTFADYAESALGIPRRNINLLIEQGATKSTIDSVLSEWLVQHASAGGDVVFFFAGHGTTDLNPSSHMAYLVPWDADPKFIRKQGVPISDLENELSALPAAHVYAFLDSCFSGAGGRSVMPPGMRPLVRGDVPKPPGAKLAMFSATGPDEITGTVDGDGLFSHYLFLGMNGAADTSGDKQITLKELVDYTTNNVADDARRDNRDQRPSLVGSPDPNDVLVKR